MIIPEATRENLGKFLSPQEHKLIGSGISAIYEAKWHTPLLIQDGANINEVKKGRDSYRIIQSPSHRWVDKDGEKLPHGHYFVDVLLSPLNSETGETMDDPLSVDDDLKYNLKSIEGLKLRVKSTSID